MPEPSDSLWDKAAVIVTVDLNVDAASQRASALSAQLVAPMLQQHRVRAVSENPDVRRPLLAAPHELPARVKGRQRDASPVDEHRKRLGPVGDSPQGPTPPDGVAEILTRHRDWSVVIEGHTDSIGGDAPNRALSERRAAAVRDRLVARHRIDGARLRSAGLGPSKPREPNLTIEGRARNRRVELARDCTR